VKVHYDLKRSSNEPLIVAIGFFDGMHQGHQDIARQARRMRRPGWRAAALTFANHPASFLRPGTQPPLISTPEERLDLIAQAGYDECFFITFDERIASQEAEHFLRDTLVRDLGVRGVVVGKSFRFGHRRGGDTELMAKIFAETGVAFAALDATLDSSGERISSTRIRRAIEAGDLHQADELLGHAYEIRGAVEHGAGRGHDLGFPTANIGVPGKMIPKDGVYSAIGRYDGRDYAALVSIGTNPTFDGTHRTIEAWLRDFEETIYGRELWLRDFRFVRNQLRFEQVEELLEQMQRDLQAIAYPSYG
jgi:riboflavin kinase / FMN adenylyltransferase